MRYTECRLERLTSSLLADIDKETVDFVPNYDEKEFEPSVLPARIPNLLYAAIVALTIGALAFAMDGAVVWQDGAPAPGVTATQRGGAVEFSGVTGSHTFAFGTFTDFMTGRDAAEQQQWRNVWPHIDGFSWRPDIRAILLLPPTGSSQSPIWPVSSLTMAIPCMPPTASAQRASSACA